MSKQTIRLDPGMHLETTGGHKHIVVDQPRPILYEGEEERLDAIVWEWLEGAGGMAVGPAEYIFERLREGR